MPEIISRKEARALGLKRYFTGKPCKHGHLAERLISDAICRACVSVEKRKYYLKNRARTLPEARNKTKRRRIEILRKDPPRCVICNRKMGHEALKYGKKACSKRCRIEMERPYKHAWRIRNPKFVLISFKCEVCEKETKCKGNGGKPRKYCSPECRRIEKDAKDWIQVRQKRSACVVCGALFIKISPQRKTCSASCGKKLHKHGNEEWRRANDTHVRLYRDEYYLNGPKNPKDEMQWLRKSRALLRSLKKTLRDPRRAAPNLSKTET